MSVIKLFILSITMLILSWCSSDYMERPTINTPFQASNQFSNTDKPYKFFVPKNGQMMRLEFQGKVPMNRWRTFDMDIYTIDNKYLFSYKDELWSESGRDSDGYWQEHKKRAYFDIRFPKQGEYLVFLSDSTNSATDRNSYRFRAIPITGNSRTFTPLMYLFGFIALGCFIVLFHRMESEGKRPFGKTLQPTPQPSKKKSNSWIYFCVGAIGIWFVAFAIASDDDDDDIDINSYYLGHSHRYSQIYVDRSMRQQSQSGSNFRAGSSKGGK